jgi:hypothetical protein
MRGTCEWWVLRTLGSAVLFLMVGAASAAAQTGIISTIAGGGANSASASSVYLPWPTSVALDKSGDVYVAIAALDEVVKIDPTGKVTVVAGTGYAGYSGDDGPATNATLDLSSAYIGVAQAIVLDESGNLYIADGVNNVVRRSNGHRCGWLPEPLHCRRRE